MSYRWPNDPNGKPIEPKNLSAEDKKTYLALVQDALRDGGPSPGADYLQHLCNLFHLGADEIVKALSTKGGSAEVAAAPVVVQAPHPAVENTSNVVKAVNAP